MAWYNDVERDDFNSIKPYCRNYEIDTITKCLWYMDYQDKFPEDMCESRTDWDELKERLYTSQYAVDYLIDIIVRLTQNQEEETNNE